MPNTITLKEYYLPADAFTFDVFYADANVTKRAIRVGKEVVADATLPNDKNIEIPAPLAAAVTAWYVAFQEGDNDGDPTLCIGQPVGFKF